VIDDLTPAQRTSLEELRAQRGPCPPSEALVEYEALPEADRAAHPAHEHIIACSRCQLALRHMAEPAAAASTSVLRWALPLAAVAVLAVALTLVNRGDQAVVTPDTGADPISTVRGSDIQILAPAGATELLREFTWQSPIRADRYRVIVRRGATEVWRGETAATRLAPPPAGTIERDVQYEWQVEALDREGHVRMTSPPQSFVVY
jgi:hypothetical protein